MALFGRSKPGLGRSIPVAVPGRRLSTALDLAACERMFRALAAEHGGYASFEAAGWQGGSAPQLLIAACANGQPALYLAAWNRGSLRELQLVPAADPAQLPQTMIGGWKMRDSSLTSTGTVTEFPVAPIGG